MNTAQLIFEGGKYKAIFEGRVLAKSGDKQYVISSITNGMSPKARDAKVTKLIDMTGGKTTTTMVEAGIVQAAHINFSITERFDFLATLVKMVIDAIAPSLLITGPGGYGKTYAVREQIELAGLTYTTDFEMNDDSGDSGEGEEGEEGEAERKNPADVHIVKGFSTAKGLYRTLWENNGKLIIFDDCDSIFRNQDAVNILKGALDSYDERWISWNAEPRMGDTNPPPKKFLFEGRIIFISNLSQSQMDGAIKSRCLRVDLSMTAPEKIERMTQIVQSGNFMKDSGIPKKTHLEAIKFLDKNKDMATELSMRTLISTTKIIVNAQNTGDNNWERLALYNLTA